MNCTSVEFELEASSSHVGFVLGHEGIGYWVCWFEALGLEACLIVGQHLAAHTHTQTLTNKIN